MKTSFDLKIMLGLAVLGLLAQAGPAQAVTNRAEDSEDSPLYAASMKNAFADMLARDRTPAAQPALPESAFGAGGIIAVEGAKWHILSTPPQEIGPRPKPLGVTTDLTCGGEPTCTYGKTCATYPTCQGGVTCNGASTCYGVTTCYYSSTCQGWYTCDNTCSYHPTCNNAPPALVGGPAWAIPPALASHVVQ